VRRRALVELRHRLDIDAHWWASGALLRAELRRSLWRRDTLPLPASQRRSAVTSLHAVLATFSYKSSRRLIEAGLLVGLVGALGLAASGRSRAVAALTGLLLAVGLGLVLVVVHFGVSPFRHR